MAKSHAERLQELNVEVGTLRERDASRKEALSELKNELKDERRARLKVENELAALKQQLADHLAQYQEWDKRRWGVVVVLLGAILSLVSGLIVALIVTLAKK